MSDMGLPFDDAPDAGPGGQRKKFILLAAVVVLVVLLGVFVGPKLLGGSKPAAKPAAAAGNKASEKAPAKKPAKKKAKPAVKKKPKPFNAAIGRDPFKALYVPLKDRAKEEQAPAAPNAPKLPPGSGPSSNNGVFKLVSVKGTGSSAKATVLWNGVQFPDVAVGQPFADGKFKLTEVGSSDCAQFAYGDMPFALCLAQTVTFTGF